MYDDDDLYDAWYDDPCFDANVAELEELEPIDDEPVTTQDVLDDWAKWWEELTLQEKRKAAEAKRRVEEWTDALDELPAKITARGAAWLGTRADRMKRDTHRDIRRHDLKHVERRATRKKWNKPRRLDRRASARWRQQLLVECEHQRNDLAGLMMLFLNQKVRYHVFWTLEDEFDDDTSFDDDHCTADEGPCEDNNYAPYHEEFYAWEYGNF